MKVDFEETFESIILMRGYNIYVQGNVSNIKKDGNVVTADVYGSRKYKVHVEIVDNIYLHGGCSCPYSEGRFDCKHIAALLYYLNNEENTIQTTNKNDLSDIINQVPVNNLKEFLQDILSSNSQLYNKFRVEFSDYFNPLTKEEYEVKIYNSIKNCCGRYSYIDYENTWEYTSAMYEYINEAEKLTQKGNYNLAFDIVSIILDSIPDTEIDDSNGSTGEVASSCKEVIYDILNSNANKDTFLTHKILTYIAEELKNEVLSNYGIELHTLLPYFINNKIYLGDLEKMLLEALDENVDKDYFYNAKFYINYLIDIYQITNQNNAIKNLLKKYSKDTAIFLKYIDLLISEKNIDEAIKLLKKRIKDNTKYYRIRDLEEYLMNIYKDNNMLVEYKEQLYKLFFEYKSYDLETYNKIKNLYDKKDWQKEKLNIIDKLKKANALRIICNIYVEEEMFDDLFLTIKDRSMDFIKTYDKYLQPKYNKELIEKYVDECWYKAKSISNRSNYRQLAYDILYITKIKGSKESVTKLIEKINDTYLKNRRAMREEFNEVLNLRKYNS